MTAANPVQFFRGSGGQGWLAEKEMTRDELAYVSSSSVFHGRGHWGESIPSRSGSAPPNMEGSLAALGSLIGLQNSNLESESRNSGKSVNISISEEQLVSDPAYIVDYYSSKGNLNPRLPHPRVSAESGKLMRWIGSKRRAWKVVSKDDSNKYFMYPSSSSLSTHKEEDCEEDKSPMLGSGVPSCDGPCDFQPTSNSTNCPKDPVMQGDYLLNRSLDDSSSHMSAKPNEDSSVYSCSNRNYAADGMYKSAELKAISVDRLDSVSHNAVSRNSDTLPSSSFISEESSAVQPVLAEKKSPNGSPGSVSSAYALSVGGLRSKKKALKITVDCNDNENVKQQFLNGSSQQLSHFPQKDFSNMATHGYSSTEVVCAVNFSEVQLNAHQVFSSPGVASSPFVAPNSFVNPLYQNFPLPGPVTPHYGINRYPLNTPMVQPVITGYSSSSGLAPIDNTYYTSMYGGHIFPLGAYFNGRYENLNSQFYKFDGQVRWTMQPLYVNPAYVQFCQHPLNSYVAAGQGELSTRSGVENLADSVNQLKVSPAPYFSDQRVQFPQSGNVTPTGKNGGYATSNSHRASPNVASPMPHPTGFINRGQPPSGTYSPGRMNDIGRFQSASRSVVECSIVQGYSTPEEFKPHRSRNFELSEIVGRVADLSADQHGSRCIQQKLEGCTAEEKESIFREVLPCANSLMTDVFGNYVIQKFFEHGTTEQRRELADKIVGHMLPLSLQMYGCRVVQKALEVIDTAQKIQLVRELDGQIMRCVHDQNGNHVIQKCIECLPADHIGFIISSFRSQVANLSVHPYGCRVIQRVLENCRDDSLGQCIVDEIIDSACSLAQDQYGNYVTQHVLQTGKVHERSQIIQKFAGQIVTMSQDKFASNVIEKCFQHGTYEEQEFLIKEIVEQTDGNGRLLGMMKDQYGNYVIQRILGTCDDKLRDMLLNRMKSHLPALKKYTYGKHIVSRVEQLGGNTEGGNGSDCESSEEQVPC